MAIDWYQNCARERAKLIKVQYWIEPGLTDRSLDARR